MTGALPSDIERLDAALAEAERDARAVAAGMSRSMGTWRAHPGSWNIAECLDHLATGNRVYLAAMRPAAERALGRGSTRRRPVEPGLIGGWFVRYLEPPVRAGLKSKAPRAIRPRPSPGLDDALSAFLESQAAVRAFLCTYANIDLAGVRFANPFIPGVRFSLATGLHVLAAHERRHLWQAWRVRSAAEAAAAAV